MDQSAYGGTASLEEFTGALRRRWWVIMLGAVLGIGMAASYLLVAPKTYIATETVVVSPVGGAGDNVVEGARVISEINLDTEAQMVTSQRVSSRAATLLQTAEPVGQLVQRVSVEVPPNTNVLRISFTGSSPDQAKSGAHAYALGYLDNRRELATTDNAAQRRALDREIALLENVWENATGADKEIALLDLQAVKARRNALVGTAVTPGEIISLALAPRKQATPDRTFVMFSGLAFGLLLGLLGVAWLDHRDGRFYDWRIIERRLKLPVLANIPTKRGETSELFPPHSTAGQAFIELRTALVSGVKSDHNLIVLSSPTRGHGNDLVVANLAAAAARAKMSTAVLIVDEASKVTDVLGIPSGDGLAEMLLGRANLSEVSQSVPGIPGLTVIATGADLAERVTDLEGAGMLRLMSALRERFDLVLVAAPPNADSADAQFLGYHADAAIPVIELARMRRPAVISAVREWELVGTPVPGAVTLAAVAEPEPWQAPTLTGSSGTSSKR